MEGCSEYSGPEGLRSVQSDCEIGEPGHSTTRTVARCPAAGPGHRQAPITLGLAARQAPRGEHVEDGGERPRGGARHAEH